LVLLTWDGARAEAVPPAYRRVEAPLVSPWDAQGVLDRGAAEALFPYAPAGLSPVETTPEIQELARGLKSDLIYEHVYDRAEHTAVFGCVKGATAVLLGGGVAYFYHHRACPEATRPLAHSDCGHRSIGSHE
jgi:hypothetical protein